MPWCSPKDNRHVASREEVVAGTSAYSPGMSTRYLHGGINVMYLTGCHGPAAAFWRTATVDWQISRDAFPRSDAQRVRQLSLARDPGDCRIEDLTADPCREWPSTNSPMIAGGKDQGSSHVQGGHRPDISQVQAMVGLQHAARKMLRANSSERRHGQALPTRPSHPDVSPSFGLTPQRRSPGLRKLAYLIITPTAASWIHTHLDLSRCRGSP